MAYFAAGETYQKGDNFYFTVYDGGGEGREPYAVAIQPCTYAPVRTLTAADGEVVRISAVGITMDNASPDRELTAQELTLHYADGTSYVVTSESQNLMNWVLGYIYGDGETPSLTRYISSTAWWMWTLLPPCPSTAAGSTLPPSSTSPCS